MQAKSRLEGMECSKGQAADFEYDKEHLFEALAESTENYTIVLLSAWGFLIQHFGFCTAFANQMRFIHKTALQSCGAFRNRQSTQRSMSL